MRVRGVFHNQGEPTPTDPCFNYAYGETEDYGITVELSTGVDGAVGQNTFLLPNPARDRCVLNSAEVGLQHIVIRDLQGREVLRMSGMGPRIELPVNGLAAGHYVVQVSGSAGTTALRLERMP
jgi:hypothetical protein